MKLRAVCLAAVCMVLLAHPAQAQETSPITPRIMGTVNEFNITPAYFSHFAQQHFGREILEEIIRARVIEDEARAQGVRVSHEDVDAEIERRESDFASEGAFAAHVRGLGLTEKGYREQVRTQMLLARLLDRAAGVTEEEARAFFDAHADQFSDAPQVRVVVVGTESPMDAMVVHRAIIDGTPLDVASRRFHEFPHIGDNGDLGWVSADTIPLPALWPLLQAMSVGDTSEPVELDEGFFIVRLMARRSGQSLAFSAVKDQIMERLRQERGISEADYVAGLLAAADVSVPWEPLGYLEKEYAALRGIRVAVDGRVLPLVNPPHINAAGIMVVPAKAVLEAVGAQVHWRPEDGILEAERAGVTLSMKVGEASMTVGGETREIPAPAQVREGVVFIPPRAVLTALGLAVDWNNAQKLLSIELEEAEG